MVLWYTCAHTQSLTDSHLHTHTHTPAHTHTHTHTHTPALTHTHTRGVMWLDVAGVIWHIPFDPSPFLVAYWSHKRNIIGVRLEVREHIHNFLQHPRLTPRQLHPGEGGRMGGWVGGWECGLVGQWVGMCEREGKR